MTLRTVRDKSAHGKARSSTKKPASRGSVESLTQPHGNSTALRRNSGIPQQFHWPALLSSSKVLQPGLSSPSPWVASRPREPLPWMAFHHHQEPAQQRHDPSFPCPTDQSLGVRCCFSASMLLHDFESTLFSDFSSHAGLSDFCLLPNDLYTN